MFKYDIAIIGGGAAGMMAAITATKNKRSVILIERNDKLGKKVLATGNGRCNLTNINANANRFHGANPEFISKVLGQFGPKKTMKFFESLGLVLKEEENGRIFPRNNQAESVVLALGEEIEREKVMVMLNSLARRIEKNNNWKIILANGTEIQADKIILAVGGKAAHQYGTSGDGYYWAEKLGHKIVATYPALAPIEIKEDWIKKAQGIKIEAKVAAKLNGKVVYEKTGDVIFTHFGISGPAAMAQARFIALNVNGARISLDLFPELESGKLEEIFKEMIELNGKKQIKNLVGGMIPGNLAMLIIKNLGINPDKKAAEIAKSERINIIKTIKNIELTPVRLRPFKEAQVTRGGVAAEEINPENMESKILPGLYFAGEIVDVDGDSGGFNLEWAWSSGQLAGISAAKS